MDGNTKNIAASVHQRLLNKSRESSRPFNELLQHFAIERFIYRLSKSPHADRFILKGALMFAAWTGLMSRPTMDIDLLGKIEDHGNGQDKCDGKEKGPQELLGNIYVNYGYAQFPSHRRVDSFVIISFFQASNTPSSILFRTSSISHK